MNLGPLELPKPLPPKPVPGLFEEDIPAGDPRNERPLRDDPLPGERVPPLDRDRRRPEHRVG